MDRAEKAKLVTALNQVFKDTGDDRRRPLRRSHRRRHDGPSGAECGTPGGSVKVAKNRLAKLALKGTDAEHIADLFKGPTVIAYSKDPVAAPKVAADFAKANEKLVILGGAMGKTTLDAERRQGARHAAVARRTARQDRRPDLRRRRPRIAQVVAAPAAQLARVVGAYARQERGGVRPVSKSYQGSNRKRNQMKWLICRRSSTTCRS